MRAECWTSMYKSHHEGAQQRGQLQFCERGKKEQPVHDQVPGPVRFSSCFSLGHMSEGVKMSGAILWEGEGNFGTWKKCPASCRSKLKWTLRARKQSGHWDSEGAVGSMVHTVSPCAVFSHLYTYWSHASSTVFPHWRKKKFKFTNPDF